MQQHILHSEVYSKSRLYLYIYIYKYISSKKYFVSLKRFSGWSISDVFQLHYSKCSAAAAYV